MCPCHEMGEDANIVNTLLEYKLNTETGKLPTGSNMAGSLWSVICIYTSSRCSVLRILIQQTLH